MDKDTEKLIAILSIALFVFVIVLLLLLGFNLSDFEIHKGIRINF